MLLLSYRDQDENSYHIDIDICMYMSDKSGCQTDRMDAAPEGPMMAVRHDAPLFLDVPAGIPAAPDTPRRICLWCPRLPWSTHHPEHIISRQLSDSCHERAGRSLLQCLSMVPLPALEHAPFCQGARGSGQAMVRHMSDNGQT